MDGDAWNGGDLLGALRHAAAMLHAQVDEVNALNVFPVPDGDTGSNMLATVQAALAEAETVPEQERSVARVSEALSMGALMGARGNSGVILSQLFRGLGDAVAMSPTVGGRELARGLEQGCRAAFAAVAQPVEGTMLTVARDVARAASAAAEEKNDLEYVLSAAVREASASVQRTPSLLPVLRRAGVVDAGGRGVELLLRGALASVHADHRSPQRRVPHDIALPALDELEEDGYGYETIFVVQPGPGARLDPGEITARLTELGESVLVAGDPTAIKVHVHNERPDAILAYGLTLGSLSRISVENLDRQASDVRARARLGQPPERDPSVAQSAAGLSVVSVVAGRGMARVFQTLGASAVVEGGQSANPSAGELAEAIHATGASSVVVLPNNSNVRLAAQQARELCPDVAIEVVPTRNAAEGVAAMLALDTEHDLAAAARAMTLAAAGIQTLASTVAVRDAVIGERQVHQGEHIVLGPSEGLLAADRERTAAILAAMETFTPGYELLTIYRGEGVDHATAEALRDALGERFEGVEIEIVDGGQPHYDFLVSAE